MKSYVLREFTGVDAPRIEEGDVPAPGPRQILVRMRAWSLNYRDLLMAQGSYGRAIAPGTVPVSDGAGEVVEVGAEVRDWQIGSRVISTCLPRWRAGRPTRAAFSKLPAGVLSEYVVFDEDAVVAAPTQLSHEQAATLPCAALTAWNAVTAGGGTLPGEVVLTMGSGGVSIFALQFAVAAGAHVIATSSSAEKLERLAGLGARDLLNYRDDAAWGRTAAKLSGGVDNVIEVGGAGTLAQSITAAGVGGRVSLIGVLTGASAMDPSAVAGKSVTVRGVTIGSTAMFGEMNRAIVATGIEPVIDSRYPFDAVPDAYRHLASGQHFGKVVISAADAA